MLILYINIMYVGTVDKGIVLFDYNWLFISKCYVDNLFVEC